MYVSYRNSHDFIEKFVFYDMNVISILIWEILIEICEILY